MSDRSEHLIERAAALLRTANAGATVPGAAAGAAAGEAAKPGVPPLQRLLKAPVPQGRPSPPGAEAGGALRATEAGNLSVSELRHSSDQVPVSIATLERAGLMVARLNRTRTTEEYRIVIGRVLRALHDGQDVEVAPGAVPAALLGSQASANVVMVTSARPGEGKSFTTLNLGGSIAQNAGESVLIVDVDGKNNSLSDVLGLSDRRGFLDLVADPTLSPDELIIPSALPNLSFLALGTRAAARGPGEDGDVEERRLTPPIKRLAQRYSRSLILLDAPPCLSTSDPHTLSPAVGQVVMVVEAEKTQRGEVEAAIEMIKVCSTITMLLNKVRMTSSHTFGTYDYFGSYT